MEQDNSTTPERVLVIVAHPDDIEFGVAGSISRWVNEGAEVTYCIITDGAAGSNEPGIDPAELAEQRREEQIGAARAVGVEDVRFLGYSDGLLEPTIELRRELTRLIREVRPERVICQDPTTVFVRGDYVNHPDHRAAGEAAIYAVFPSAGTRPIFPELLDEGYRPHDVKELYMTLTLKPDVAVDISGTIERKLEALLCHESQVGPDAADRVRGWNAEAGEEVGYGYAEVFRVMRLDRRGKKAGE
jgi:LmbE family N-acetylglucosaminyl deacetylase